MAAEFVDPSQDLGARRWAWHGHPGGERAVAAANGKGDGAKDQGQAGDAGTIGEHLDGLLEFGAFFPQPPGKYKTVVRAAVEPVAFLA